MMMRRQTVKQLMVLGALIAVTSIGAGCTQLRHLDLLGDSGSSVSTPRVASPGSQKLSAIERRVVKQQAKSLPSQGTNSAEWLLQPSLFGVQHGMWLGWIAFVVGLFGFGLAVFSRVQSLRHVNQLKQKLFRHDKDLERAYAEIHRLSNKCKEYSQDLASLHKVYQQLEDKQATILASVNSLRVQQMPEPQSYAVAAPSLSSKPLVASQHCEPTPAQKQAELTAAVNRGDRQAVKSETRAQLNITHASENAISMGRLNDTQLEEVSAGGSYWAASVAGEIWLYPTEQTLKGYSQSQRPTGIFNYSRQPIPTAQVVAPARLTLSGTLWQVVEMGSIAVPG
jgi:hypothetical protein